MTPKLFTAVLLFISAYSPLFVILIVKNFDFIWFEYPIIVYIIISLIVVSNVLLFLSISGVNRGNMQVKVISIKDRSLDLISYTIPYIVLFVGVDLSKWGDIISLAIFLLMMMLLTIKSKAVFLNPVLLMCGYGLYDIEYSFNGTNKNVIVLSKNTLRPNDLCYIISVSKFLYFVTEVKENE